MADDESWVVACAVDDLPPGEVLPVPGTIPAIAVYNVDGEFFATDDTCTHEVSSLAEGYVDGDVVECAFHFAKFCIRTGAVLSFPATEPLGTYSVRVVDDKVHVDTASRTRPAR
ncbi:bifunctional 3-phenylpropionate/cinnamic acid dioxygenase ferredoxin subunit [Blastococcus sp. SYSU D00669]